MGQKQNNANRALAELRHYTEQDKLEIAVTYLATGSMAQTASIHRMSERTLMGWQNKQWWQDLLDRVRIEDNIVLSARARNIIERGLEVLVDRLENGDWIYDQKTGELRRKPVGIRDATHAVSMMMDKKMLLDKAQNVIVDQGRVEEKLDKLMAKFAEMSTGKKAKVVEVTDVVFGEDSALHEERETRLQEGERAVQQQAGTDQTSE